MKYFICFVLVCSLFTCAFSAEKEKTTSNDAAIEGVDQQEMSDADKTFKLSRIKMVNEQIKARGIKSKSVIEAMMNVPRHKFVPEDMLTGENAVNPYADSPIKLGEFLSISPPYVVARMTELLELTGEEKILEVGTGSGYHTAILSQNSKTVYTIEYFKETADQAKINLKDYENVTVINGDGFKGLPKQAPFDCIIVTFAPDNIPEPLVEQLKEGGIMVIPVGNYPNQLLKVGKKHKGEFVSRNVMPATFVPMQKDEEGEKEDKSKKKKKRRKKRKK